MHLFRLIIVLLLFSCITAQRPCPRGCRRNRRFLRRCFLLDSQCTLVRCRRSRRRFGFACVPIVDPTPSPSISASSSPTASVTPTASATPTPSVTPTSSTTPSPSSSVTPSPSPFQDRFIVERTGVTCPSGSSIRDFGQGCDLNAVEFQLFIGPSSAVGFPPRTSCVPANLVAGGGRAGCTICGDDTSNSVRELHIIVDGRQTGCPNIDLVLPLFDALSAIAISVGETLCPRDFNVNDGGTFVTRVLPSLWENALASAYCTPGQGSLTTIAETTGVTCPAGTSFKDFGSNCDLTAVNFDLIVGRSNQLGVPARSSCVPANIVAGGGRAACTICGDDSSNSVRELHIFVDGSQTDCSNIDMVLPIFDAIEAIAIGDGVTLCPRDYTDDDGGDYIKIVLPAKFETILGQALCE